jgi:hypothetical protein
MIDLQIGTVREPRWRQWLQLKPRTWIYIQHQTGYRQPVARFIPGMDKEFWLWMDQQGEQLSQLVDSLLKSEREALEND